MKKLGFAALASLISGIAIAYPTKQEIAEARPLVAELMNPVLAEYKNKFKSASEVAEASIQFSESAKSEAVKYLFLRGAVGYYIKGSNFLEVPQFFRVWRRLPVACAVLPGSWRVFHKQG